MRLQSKDVYVQLGLANNNLAVLVDTLCRSDLESVDFDPHTVKVRIGQIQTLCAMLSEQLSVSESA